MPSEPSFCLLTAQISGSGTPEAATRRLHISVGEKRNGSVWKNWPIAFCSYQWLVRQAWLWDAHVSPHALPPRNPSCLSDPCGERTRGLCAQASFQLRSRSTSEHAPDPTALATPPPATCVPPSLFPLFLPSVPSSFLSAPP